MTATALESARKIEQPTRQAVLHRDHSVNHFWDANRDLFAKAWEEWEAQSGLGNMLDEGLFAPQLRLAVQQAWDDPTKEGAVKDLWAEVFPGVYSTQFFDLERLADLREYMDKTADAEIPVRPPYGIVLNRYGAMLDPRSEGYLAAPKFQTFYQMLMERYMRPVARLLYPDVYGYDSQTFGFSIRWQPDKDAALRAHTDASSVTLNLNLNLPGEPYTGSGLRYFDRVSRQVGELFFEPGQAMIHHGSVPHESMPITSGERSNWVLWLYGKNGQIVGPISTEKDVPAQDRWKVPSIEKDGFAPF